MSRFGYVSLNFEANKPIEDIEKHNPQKLMVKAHSVRFAMVGAHLLWEKSTTVWLVTDVDLVWEKNTTGWFANKTNEQREW